jgi:predicted ATP-dependent protease
MIPAANVRHLILRPDVIEAVERGQFHIYPVRTIDEGIALLTGVRAGTSEEEGTVNGLVNKRLRELATNLKAFGAGGNGAEPKKSINDEQPEKDKPKDPPA